MRSPLSVLDTEASFTLRIERSMAGLENLGGWVDGIAAALRLDTRVEYALRLCLEEATANVVMHGDGDDAGVVALRVDATPDTLQVTIEDRCAAFDPLAVAAPTPPTSLEAARIGGLGVHLMRQYARALRYERTGDANRLTITIARSNRS